MSEVSGIEKRQHEKNNRTLKKKNIWFFEQIKTIDKILVRLIRKREMEHNNDCQEQKRRYHYRYLKKILIHIINNYQYS